MRTDGKITLAHGSGGALMHELIEELIAARLANPVLSGLDDAAEIVDILADAEDGDRLAFTTDSYVVQPLFFPGGDIGKLCVCGTVNDLAMKGARPAYLTLGLVLEEGLPVGDLERVLDSIAETSREAGVSVAAGDTKVVERGAVGGLIVNTAGLGIIPSGVNVSGDRARPGDAVIISGTIGDHETAILVARENLRLEQTIESDCAPLGGLVDSVLSVCSDVHVMRDPTRGGLGTTLNEIAGRSEVSITFDEKALPIDGRVRSVCEILGFDPVYMANEGKMIAVVPRECSDDVVRAMRGHPLGERAAVIGSVEEGRGVRLRTEVGGLRPVVMLEGVQLPRIC
ncbi:MAG: hydrogenase expression/formation protein HypE [Candidatus Eisenbacteria bacterium]|nr:hydrogenase expression/formation protein HypE [Candidatus Eisenbacteria bacterium]